jgi:hypothetical protein
MYAILLQHLVLDTNTPQYSLNSPYPVKAINTMHEQIANDMHVCVSVKDGIESLHAIVSLEPILLEVASQAMVSNNFSLPPALSMVLTGYCIGQGELWRVIG